MISHRECVIIIIFYVVYGMCIYVMGFVLTGYVTAAIHFVMQCSLQQVEEHGLLEASVSYGRNQTIKSSKKNDRGYVTCSNVQCTCTG